MLSCWAHIQPSLCRLPLHQFKEWEESGSDFTCSVRVRGSEGLRPRHVRRWASGEMCWDQKPQIPAGPRQTLSSLPQTSLKPCPIPSATSTWWSREPISWLLSLWRRAERTRGTKRWVWTFKIHGWQVELSLPNCSFFVFFATAMISRLCFRLFFFKSPYDWWHQQALNSVFLLLFHSAGIKHYWFIDLFGFKLSENHILFLLFMNPTIDLTIEHLHLSENLNFY